MRLEISENLIVTAKVLRVTPESIEFGENVRIDRATWMLSMRGKEYTLCSRREENLPEHHYFVESHGLRFCYDDEYEKDEMLHPRWIGQAVVGCCSGDHWGYIVDMEEDGYRKDDGRFVFHETHGQTWDFGSTSIGEWQSSNESSSSIHVQLRAEASPADSDSENETDENSEHSWNFDVPDISGWHDDVIPSDDENANSPT